MKKNFFRLALGAAAMILGAQAVSAQNPFLPLWEYIPDGEPYVFEDPDKPGEYRVYVYGSHDSEITRYCGLEQVAWSAPVNDLKNWRYDGIIFQVDRDANGNLLNANGKRDLLYAPDVCEVIGKDGKKTYYLYPNNQARGRGNMIAKSDRPDGPFEVCNWSPDDPKRTVGPLSFDPGVFIDDDGRVYGYWGFEKSFAAELDPETMCTVKPGTEIVVDMVSNYKQEGIFNFFEASSIRKIKDKYVFIYSRYTKEGEFGLPTSNYTLAYAYSDKPLGPWTYGGTIIDGRGRKTVGGKTIPTATPYGNTHGSIFEANGQWWLVYHRQSGTDEYSRQAMAAPLEITVEEGKGGKVFISEAEYTSEGFMTEGLNPFHRNAAALACYYTGPSEVGHDYPHFYFSGSYVQPRRLDEQSFDGPYSNKIAFQTVVNNTAGSVVGYKYFNFTGIGNKATLEMRLKAEGFAGKMTVMIGAPTTKEGGVKVGELSFDKLPVLEETTVSIPLSGMAKFQGKRELYFVFDSPVAGKSLCELYDFIFRK